MEQYFIFLTEPNRTAMQKVYEEYKERILKSKGSKSKHQAWEGGYIDHVNETIEIALDLYKTLNQFRPLGFTINEVVLVLLLHDIEKPFKYVEPKLYFVHEGLPELHWKLEFIRHRFSLTKEQENAIRYIHGEPDSEYNKDTRIMNSLAAFCHCCDVISSRIWFDYPKKSEKHESDTL